MKIAIRNVSLGMDRFSGLYLWAAFIIIFGVLRPSLFLTSATVHSVASQQAVAAMLALAILMPLASGAYDLSIGANINLAAVLVSIMQVSWHVNMVLAIVLTVLVGVVIGLINGFIVVKLHVSSFIATLGMATVIAAVQTIVTNNLEPNPVISKTWSNLTQYTVGGFQIIFVYLIVLALIMWWVLDHMPIGRFTYAVGSNAEAARLSGVRVGKYAWISLVVSGGLCSFAGVCYASFSGPSLTFGEALLLPAYAAAFLGCTQIKPGRFNVWGTMIAVYVLATGVIGIEYLTNVQWLNDMFNGVALILAVSFAVWRQRSDARHTAARDDAGSMPLSEEEELSMPGAPPIGTGDVPGSSSAAGGDMDRPSPAPGHDIAPAARRT
jgi:ribose transport system permease protein